MGSRSDGYNTKQQEIINGYIKGLGNRHITAAEIIEHFKNAGIAIGRTTVYRHLEKLEAGGMIRRYTIDGTSAACYQYMPDSEGCALHFHLKCEDCGDVIHLDCDMIEEVHRHISAEHRFKVNGAKSIIYGKCIDCETGAK